MEKWTDSFGKPRGFWGKVLLNTMNKEHEKLTLWGLAFADIQPGEKALDVGCGGGNAIRLMAARGARVTGVDYSPLSVEKSLKKNLEAVREGRVEVLEGSVEALPFADGTFDAATAFETIYFWPDLEQNFGEVLRVLKPGGQFCAVFEVPGDRQRADRLERRVKGMRIPAPEMVKDFFGTAGFDDVRIQKRERKGGADVCVIGKKRAGKR